MHLKEVIRSQYAAALEMLKQAIAKCPDSMWDDPNHKNRFWHVAYHALFYTDLYVRPSERDFAPWDKHRDEYEFMGPLPWPPHKEPAIGEPYSKQDVLEYLGFSRNMLMGVVVLVAMPRVAAMLTGRYAGGLVDGLGCRTVLKWSHLVWSMIPAGLFLMRPGEHVVWQLAGFFLLANFATNAAINARQKLVTRLPKREDRSMYIAVSTCHASVAAGVGCLAGGEILQALDGWSYRAGGFELVGFHVIFAISAALRLASTSLTRFLPDRETERAYVRAAEGRRRPA